MDFSCLFAVVVLPACFLLGRSAPVYRLFLLLSSVNCFSSVHRFALVHRRNCSCSYSRQFRFSPSIVYALVLAHSASVRRLILLFLSINSFSSRQFRFSPSIVFAVLVVHFASVGRCFSSSSRPFRFSPSIVSALLVY